MVDSRVDRIYVEFHTSKRNCQLLMEFESMVQITFRFMLDDGDSSVGLENV
jgi:hypothetical protein